MKNIIILAQAEKDIATSTLWMSKNFSHEYSLKVRSEIFLKIDKINWQSVLYAKVYREFRKVLIRKYKYSIFYKIKNDDIYIYAVLSQKQDIMNILNKR